MGRLSAILLAFLLLCAPALCEETTLRYALRAEGAVLTGLTGETPRELILPESISGRPVVEIAEGAFAGLAIESLTLPGSVLHIGKEAFRGCALREIRFSRGLLSIGEEAFAECRSLLGCALPDSLVSIADGAFQDCDALRYVTLPASVAVLSGEPFAGCARLSALPMPADHPHFVMEDGALIARADGLILFSLPKEEQDKETP